MARYGKEHKEETHRKVVEAASRRFRKDGIEATGVVDLMADVGLTHGGFYAHFESRDELIREAAARAFDAAEGRTAAALEDAEDPLAAFADFYLSAEHRDGPANGCAMDSKRLRCR